MSKKISDLTSEELAAFLDGNEAPTFAETPPVLEFIERFDLKNGKTPVQSRLLYGLFQKYIGADIGLVEFTKQASTLLEYRQTKFYLDGDSKLLFHELVKESTVQTKVSPSSPAMQRHMNNYITKTGTVAHTKPVPAIVFYDHYRCFCIDINYRKPKKYKVFVDYFKQHFKHITQGELMFFIINTELKSLNKEGHATIKAKYKKRKVKKSKKQS